MNKQEQYIESHYSSILESLFQAEFTDVVYEKNNQSFYLRLFIDTLTPDQSVDLNLCERVNRHLSNCFDEDPDFPIKTAYHLEVSSPGIERPLKKPDQFKRFIDSQIKVKFYKPIDGEKQCIGRLLEADDVCIVIKKQNEQILRLMYEDIAKANIYFEF